jgi:predicted porin
MKSKSGQTRRMTLQTRNIAAALCTLLAATAVPEVHAQTTVEVYGLVGAYLGSVKRSDAVGRTTIEGNGGLTTPYLGFRGKEDLGGNLAAVFQFENFFQVDNGGAGRTAADPSFASRSSWVGLKGDFGQVTFGRHTSQFYLAQQAVNPFQSSVNFSPLVVQSFVTTFGGTLSGDTVWSNAVQYATPEAAGFSGTVLHSLGETAGDAGANNTSLSVRYENGPLVATAIAQRVRIVTVAPSTEQNAYLGGLSYDLQFVKLYGSVQASDRNVTDVRSRTYQIGASVPVTPVSRVLASWARTKNLFLAAPDTTRNTATLGFDYSLSKRTDVYAIYMYDKFTANVVGNTYATGIRHTF